MGLLVLNLLASVSRIFFRCLIFNWYNISICEKEKLKDETSKKVCETIVSKIFLRCLIFDCYNISICKKGKVRDERSKKNRENNGGMFN